MGGSGQLFHLNCTDTGLNYSPLTRKIFHKLIGTHLKSPSQYWQSSDGGTKAIAAINNYEAQLSPCTYITSPYLSLTCDTTCTFCCFILYWLYWRPFVGNKLFKKKNTYPNIKWIEGMFPLKNKFARVYSNTSFPTKHSIIITVVAHDSCAEAWPFSACHEFVRSSAFCRCGTDFPEIWPRVEENLNKIYKFRSL